MTSHSKHNYHPYPHEMKEGHAYIGKHLNYERRKAPEINPNNFVPNFYNPFEIKHRRRVSHEQARLLQEAFLENPQPNREARLKLAETLSMTPRRVQVWFQNKRAKQKRQKRDKDESEKVPLSPSDMVPSCSHSSMQSFLSEQVFFSIAHDNSLQTNSARLSQEWSSDTDRSMFKMIDLSFVQPQVQLSARFSPVSFSHQTSNQTQFASTINDQKSQTCSYMNNTTYPCMYIANYLQNTEFWCNEVSQENHMLVNGKAYFNQYDERNQQVV